MRTEVINAAGETDRNDEANSCFSQFVESDQTFKLGT